MLKLLFVHGWGFEASMWDGIRARLPDPGIALDLGYFTQDRPPPPPACRIVGVGHSFGALWLLHEMAPLLDGYVAINGFARFTAAPDHPHAVPPRILARMRSGFARAPARVLADFHRLCGTTPPAAPRHEARLAADLGALAAWDERHTLRALPIPRLALAAADDPLLPPAPGHPPHLLAPDGGHVLPLTRPAWCATHIAALLA